MKKRKIFIGSFAVIVILIVLFCCDIINASNETILIGGLLVWAVISTTYAIKQKALMQCLKNQYDNVKKSKKELENENEALKQEIKKHLLR